MPYRFPQTFGPIVWTKNASWIRPERARFPRLTRQTCSVTRSSTKSAVNPPILIQCPRLTLIIHLMTRSSEKRAPNAPFLSRYPRLIQRIGIPVSLRDFGTRVSLKNQSAPDRFPAQSILQKKRLLPGIRANCQHTTVCCRNAKLPNSHLLQLICQK